MDYCSTVAIQKLHLISPTPVQPGGRAIRQVARTDLDGHELNEGLLNHIEVAIRAFDPCLSCATHALGRMPLMVEILDADGALVDRLVRGGE